MFFHVHSPSVMGREERLLLRLAEEARNGGVSEELWAELRAAWPPAKLERLLALAGVAPPAGDAPPRVHLPIVTRRVVAPRTVLLVASLGVFMAFVDATIVNIAFPDIQRSFPGSSISGLSWIFNAYNIVFAALLVAAGRAADLLGRKRMFEKGLWLFTLASVLCAVAPSAELLVAARVLQAVGAAVVVPASLALVMQAYPPSERTAAVALWAASGALAAGIGPSLGGVLVDLTDWRAAFLVNLPIGIAALVAARRTLVESRAAGRRTLPDLLGAACFGGAVALLVLGIVQGEDLGWDSGLVVGAFAAAVVLAVCFVARSRRHESPILDLALFRIRSFSAANALMVLAAAAYFALILNNVLFLTSVWGYSVLEAGLALTPGPFIAAAVAGPVGRLAQRHDLRPFIAGGALIWGAGALMYARLVGRIPPSSASGCPRRSWSGRAAGSPSRRSRARPWHPRPGGALPPRRASTRWPGSWARRSEWRSSSRSSERPTPSGRRPRLTTAGCSPSPSSPRWPWARSPSARSRSRSGRTMRTRRGVRGPPARDKRACTGARRRRRARDRSAGPRPAGRRGAAKRSPSLRTSRSTCASGSAPGRGRCVCGAANGSSGRTTRQTILYVVCSGRLESSSSARRRRRTAGWARAR